MLPMMMAIDADAHVTIIFECASRRRYRFADYDAEMMRAMRRWPMPSTRKTLRY